VRTEFVDDGASEKGENDVGEGVDAVEEIEFHGEIAGGCAGAHVVLELLMERRWNVHSGKEQKLRKVCFGNE